MFFYLNFINLSINLTIIVALIAIIGDYLTSLRSTPIVKALCDNVTHALIGGLCWGIFCLNRDKSSADSRKILFEVFCCTIISSFIDLDHFVAAKSIFLKDVTKLKHRPILHCSTIPLVVFGILLLFSYALEQNILKRGALILLTAFATHHIRDATRRGLWFYPFGSTMPIPYFVYVALICFTPYFIVYFDRKFKVGKFKVDTSVYSQVI